MAGSPSSSGRPDISWPLERSDEPGTYGPRVEAELRRRSADLLAEAAAAAEDAKIPLTELLPGQKRSQSGIASQAFFLGLALGVAVLLTYYYLCVEYTRLWRPFFFLAALALFHFLEFWTTAEYNVPNATSNAFLIFDNGVQYQIAHGSAMLETVITSYFFPEWQSYFSLQLVQCTGLVCILLGQIIRTVAMATAATNFNHRVQHRRKLDHNLVTSGIYGLLRHPSYFGFFWWALGTQLVLGNPVCFLGFIVVLWKFFSARIRVEEKHLVEFFGNDYVQYRKSTGVGIPFIR